MAAKVLGNLEGLKASQVKALGKLYQRRYPQVGGYTREQARELAALTASTGRQIGLLIDRQGRPAMVIAGTPNSIFIPELGRGRMGPGRLRGVRLLHTHLSAGGLSGEDLTDMLFLRLDSVAALSVTPSGEPDKLQAAHLMPPNPDNTPYQTFDPEPWDRVETDFTAMAEALEDELSRLAEAAREHEEGERAVLIHVSELPGRLQERSLDELAALAETAGVFPAARLTQRVKSVNPKFILGKGKLADLEVLALQNNADLVLFDRELSPAQMRNLAQATERKIIDRTQLILDIFAQHAVTRAGKLQVEMAQLQYRLPRLIGKNRALSRLMGGIGGRGPGETKLEIDRRRVRDKITRIKNELKNLRKRRGLRRERRAKSGVPVVGLVGYTNAGKSTLLNTLTRSEVLAENKLFATLDPTSRRIRFPKDREVILTDTVGFIRHLPVELKEAFRATLEELEAADILVHVADAGHPEVEEQVRAVEAILDEMKLEEIPQILALNKWDTVEPEMRDTLLNVYPTAVPIQATNRRSLKPLVEAIEVFFPE